MSYDYHIGVDYHKAYSHIVVQDTGGKPIETISGTRYSESGVWRLLKALGFSNQRPTGRAIQRDEHAIRRSTPCLPLMTTLTVGTR